MLRGKLLKLCLPILILKNSPCNGNVKTNLNERGVVILSKKIQVLRIAPDEYPFIDELSTSKYDICKAVSVGCKHRYKAGIKDLADGVCVIYNRDRAFSNLKPCRKVLSDILCGVLYIAGKNRDGSLKSLEYEELVRYSDMFWEPETYTKEDAKIANLYNNHYSMQISSALSTTG